MNEPLGLATTFRADEVILMLSVMKALNRGGDVTVYLRRVEWGGLVKKFQQLDQKRKRANGEG